MRKFVLFTVGLLIMTGLSAQEIYTLEDFRESALRENSSIKIANERILIAKDLKNAALTQFFPRLSLNGSYQWNEKNISLLGADAMLPVGTKMPDGSFGFRPDQINNKIVDLPGGVSVPLDENGMPFDPRVDPSKIQWKDYAYLPKEAMEFDVQNVLVGNIGLVQPIFMGLKIKELYSIAKTGEKIALAQDKDQKENLILEVDEAYWRVVSLYNKKELAKSFVDLLSTLEGNVNLMCEEGVATKGDLLNVRVKKNEVSMLLARAENGYELSRMALYQLCGIELSSNIQLADSDIEQTLITPEQIADLEDVYSSRSDIKTLELMGDLAQSNVNLKASRFMPNIVANVNYMVSNPNVFNGFQNKFSGMFNAGVTLNIPICHWGEEVFTLRAAKRERKIAQYRIQDAKEKIALQISQQTYRLEEANKKMEMSLNNISSADENARFAKEAFEAGLISATDMMKAQSAWISANSDRIDASIDLRMCNSYLKKAQGKILVEEPDASEVK